MQAIHRPDWQVPGQTVRQRPNRLRRIALMGLAAGLWGPAAIAQPAPAAAADRLDKPVHIIVAYGAGGASDAIARFVSDGLSKRTDKPVIVENKAGADGNIAAEAAVRAPATAHTLLVSGSSTHAANATIYRKLPYDPEADFTPLAAMASTPFVLLANPKRIQAPTFREFLAWARKENKELSFASANVGGRISGELFKQRAGLKAVNVPYRNSSQAMTDLIGGQFDYYLCDMVTALPQIQAGTVRARRSPAPSACLRCPTCRRWRKAASRTSTSARGSPSGAPTRRRRSRRPGCCRAGSARSWIRPKAAASSSARA